MGLEDINFLIFDSIGGLNEEESLFFEEEVQQLTKEK